MRNGFELALNKFTSESLGIDELSPSQCGINGMKEWLHIILTYIPDQLNNVVGSEGFDMKTGSWGAAQGKKVNPLSLKLSH